MRVLHLPVNTASRLAITVRALRENGLDAYGLVFATSHVQSFEGVDAIWIGNKKQPHQALLGIGRFVDHLLRYLKQGKPDLVHWYYSGSAATLNADLALLRFLDVPGIVEWQGSEIRIPEIEFAENPYYTAAFHNGYEYRHVESLALSRQRQQRFTEIGLCSSVAAGMEQYVQPDIVPHFYQVQQRLPLADFHPVYPDTEKRVPLVVHSPTAKVTKGTDAVLRAVDALKGQVDFDFRLIHGLSRAEALHIVQSADIFLDQFVLGDRGLAALEAMALGKPVICYIKPSLVAKYPPELPIVNATQDTLADTLRSLIVDGNRRRQLGQQGRAYVETHHDSMKIARQLIGIYEEISPRHRNLA